MAKTAKATKKLVRNQRPGVKAVQAVTRRTRKGKPKITMIGLPADPVQHFAAVTMAAIATQAQATITRQDAERNGADLTAAFMIDVNSRRNSDPDFDDAMSILTNIVHKHKAVGYRNLARALWKDGGK